MNHLKSNLIQELRSGLACALLCGAVVAGQAKTIELEPVADVAFLYSSVPPYRQNFINGGATIIGAALHYGKERGSCSLLRFDLSAVPGKARIKSAQLVLNPTFTQPLEKFTGKDILCVFQLAQEDADWVEGEGRSIRDMANDPITVPGANGSYVNMESYVDETNHNGIRWLSGNTIGLMDFSGDRVGSVALSETGVTENQTLVIEISPEAIQAWLQKPELAKAGLALWMMSDEQQIAEPRFACFEGRDGNIPPQLIIEYTEN